ncbi:MAG: hypothetical protein ACXADO_00710 [Candidatus Thorarchaeota archaeon]|jgi:hypothetical protein
MGILKDKPDKKEKWKESIGKGEEPGRFFRNWFKLGLVANMLVMLLIFLWIFWAYPDAGLPIMIFGIVSLAVCASLTGLLEYDLVVKEGTHIDLGNLSPMPFMYGEYPMATKVTFKTKDGTEVEETWVGGRLGKATGWWGSWGGGRKGYWTCRLCKKARLDESHNPTTVIWEDAEEAGYWKGSHYVIPMNFTLTDIDQVYDEVAEMIRGDTARYRWNSRIYVADRPLPEKFRKARSPTTTQAIINALNEQCNKLRAEIKSLYKDRARDKATQPVVTKEVHYPGPGGGQ